MTRSTEWEDPWGPGSAWCRHGKIYKDGIEKHLKLNGDIRCIVEIGIHFGWSFFTMAKDFPNALVVGVDDFSYHDSDIARAHLQKHAHQFPNIRIIEGKSEEVIRIWRQPRIYCDIDLLHLDGDHTYEAVKKDFEIWSRCVTPGGGVMFHDIHSFPDDVGRFFNELEGEKHILDDNSPGLGLWVKDA